MPGGIKLHITQIRQSCCAGGIGAIVKSRCRIDVVLILLIPRTHVQILTTGGANRDRPNQGSVVAILLKLSRGASGLVVSHHVDEVEVSIFLDEVSDAIVSGRNDR